LERENNELKRASEILRKAAAFFRPGRARPQTEVMVSFIDQHRDIHWVEPICALLPMAPSTYYRHKTCEAHPERTSARSKRDQALLVDIQRV